MSTDTNWLNLYVAKVMGFQALSDDFVDSVRGELDAVHGDLWGARGGYLTAASLTATAAQFALDATVNGYTGEGKRIALNILNAEWIGVPFANSGATPYFVAAHAEQLVPGGAELAADGSAQFSRYIEKVGEIVTPSAVVDNGTTLTLTIAATGVHASWGTDTGTRPVRVWLVSPDTSGAEHVYDGTAAYDGAAAIKVTTTHQFGQSTVSTTPADYRILVEGPTISTSSFASDPEYAQIGTITSGVFSAATQLAFTDYGTLSNAFTVEHDLAGLHTAVNADSYALNSDDTGIVAIYTADDFGAYAHTQEDLTASPTLQRVGFNQGTDWVQMWLDAAINGESRLYIPLRLPGNVTITHFKIVALRNTITAEVECRIVRALVSGSSTAARALVGSAMSAADTSGAWVTSAKTSLTAFQLAQTDADRLELEVRMKNDGATSGTGRFGQIILYGKHSTHNGAGWASKT